MPHKNIWIRKADEAAWDDILNKAEFIHNALTDNVGYPASAHIGEPIIIPKKTARKLEKTPNGPVSVCEHYQLKGNCLVKGCKYGRN